MKKLLFFVVTVFAVLPAFAERMARQPEFANGTIKMSANGGLCGGFTIDPIIDGDYGDVFIRSYRYSKNLLGELKPGRPLSDWQELPEGGLRVGYDWAGPRPSYHYRVFCKARNMHGKLMLVDCKKVVTIRDVKHNRPCVWGAAGANALYEPLNMRVSDKK